MEKKELQALQTAIREKQLIWSAGETSVSALSKEEEKSLLGLVPTEVELAGNEKAITSANSQPRGMMAIAAPAAIDWRNNGGDWTTPIKDQKSCGSCVAFGTVATLEARVNIACKNPALDVDLSEAHLFYCGCGNCCSTGWGFQAALDFCKNTGVGKEADFPYIPGNQPCKTIPYYVKITASSQVLSMADRKTVISGKGPVLAGMAVYADFFAYRSGVYRHTSSDLRGYHAVCVVGYSDAENCWIVKNSWGTGWGENGWFKIAYGDSMIDTQFPFYDVTLICPIDTCIQYKKPLAQVLMLAMRNLQLRRCLCYYVCRRVGIRPICAPTNLAVVRAVLAILQKCPQYKAGFCKALACGITPWA